MPTPIDISKLIQDIQDVTMQILGQSSQDVKTISSFSERQAKAIAEQTILVTEGILSGEITEATRDFFLDGLKDMALNFVKTFQGLVAVAIEKAWNGVVGVVWKAIEGATGVALPATGLTLPS